MVNQMAQRCLWLILITLGACFSPKFNDGAITCGPDDLCPPGLECSAGVCRAEALPIDAPPDSPGMVTLTLTKSGTGTGDVTSVPAGVNCGATCIGTFPAGTMVTLTASAANSSTFARWSGACTGSSTTCTLVLSANTSATAEFAQVMRTLTVISSGNGTGGITSSAGGVNCPGVCTVQVPDQSQVVLTAAPTGASTFLGWTAPGICSGTGTCDFKISANTTVTGSFALDFSVLVTKSGTGTGTVVSTTPANGITCGADCDQAYAVNTVVTLDATPTGNSDFIGWSGGCTGTASCVVTVTSAVMVTAKFDLKQIPLTVTLAGTGTGTVTSNPLGINCTGDCNESYPSGTPVTLTAVANTGSMFTGWSDPACPGTGACVVTLSAAKTVTANFALTLHTLDVVKNGNGGGTVTSGSGGISCGTDCTDMIPSGTVLLTAAADTGSVFTGWSVPTCGSALMCAVSVTAATTVTATFTLRKEMLTTSISGSGTGSVASMPTGITCGSSCSAMFDYGTLVTLTPSPGADSFFARWSGACSGTDPCVVTMDQTRFVDVEFRIDSHLLTVVLGGAGNGSVTSTTPPGISCTPGPGADCTESYIYDTNVVLNANATAPSIFVGWSGGGCTGNGNSCVVDMKSAQTVTATFSPPPNRMFVTSQTFVMGSIGGQAGADAKCQAAAVAVSLPGTYRAWLSSSSADAIDRLGTASGWVRVDGRPFANTQANLAAGQLYHPARIDEKGVDVGDTDLVVTATTDVGGFYNGSGDCAGYTDPALGGARTGSTAATSILWTSWGAYQCSTPVRLYCFGVDRPATVIPQVMGPVRRAFMRLWTPGGGIVDADASCQADAVANNLAGNYKALLPTTTFSAISRFTTTTASPNWVRTDNVPILPSAFQWTTAGLSFYDTPPNLSADGTYHWPHYAHWSGATSMTAIGTNGATCSNWTNQAQSATWGSSAFSSVPVFWGTNGIQCNFTSGTIVCLQE